MVTVINTEMSLDDSITQGDIVAEAAAALSNLGQQQNVQNWSKGVSDATATAKHVSINTVTTKSVSESIASNSSHGDQSLNNEIRVIVKSKLDPKRDSRKIRHISAKGKSIKFPVKLMYVLEECTQYEHIISWSEDGLSFEIHDSRQFEIDVLPVVFKDAKFNSFLRKLYRWGFNKKSTEGSDSCIYTSSKFQQGNYSLCMEMTCANRPSSVIPAAQIREAFSADGLIRPSGYQVLTEAQVQHNNTIAQLHQQKQLMDHLLIQQQKLIQQQQMAEIMSNRALLQQMQGLQNPYNSTMQVQRQMERNAMAQNMQNGFSASPYEQMQTVLDQNPPYSQSTMIRKRPMLDNENDAPPGIWRRGGNY